MELNEFEAYVDELMRTSSRNEKENIVTNVYDEGGVKAISLLIGSEFSDSGIGDTTVRNIAVPLFGQDIPDTDPHAQVRTPPLCTSTALRMLAPESAEVSVAQLYDEVQHVAQLSGTAQHDELARVMGEYTTHLVTNVFLQDLATGVSDKTVARALGVTDSLPFYESVVDVLHADVGRQSALTSPMAGEPFRPMLAKSESHMPASLDGYLAQPKIDGYRLVIHLVDGEASAFTRRMTDVTESLPELDEIAWPDGRYVLDAEVVAQDGSYNSTSSRIGRSATNVDRSVGMEFAVFDMIIHDGILSANQTQLARTTLCDMFAQQVDDDRVYALPVFTADEEVAARVAASAHEGLIWKQAGASYTFGKRSSAWVKEKHTAESVDVVAVGFEEGSGRLSGSLGKVYIESSDGVPLGATGSGFTDAERREVWDNRDTYLGAPLEVSAEALDAQGSLRFPIFQRWRMDDGSADTLARIEDIMGSTT